MALKVPPYLVTKPGAGGATRHYWQPAKPLQAAGWASETLGTDPVRAFARARAINIALEGWRAGEPVPAGMPFVDRAEPTRRRGKVVERGTVDDLFARFRASRFFKDLKPKTRTGYEWAMDVIGEVYGDEPARAVTAQDREALYGPMRKQTPAKANAVVRVGRLVWNLSQALGLPLDANPWEKARLKGLEKSGRPWPRAAIAAFVDCADRMGYTGVADAVALNHWLGQREGDILALPRTILSASEAPVRQGKGGIWVVLPLTMVPQIRARLALMKARAIVAPTAIVNHATGRAYNEHTFRHDVAAVRRVLAAGDAARAIAPCPSFATDYVIRGRASLADAFTLQTSELVFKNLRHAAVLFLVEAGVSREWISAITGHTLKSIDTIIETYLVRTRAQAIQAFQRRMDHESRAQGDGT